MMPRIKNVWRKGTTELRLVSSRDAGRTWQRVCEKSVWLPCSAEPHGYDRLVFAQYPIRVDNEMRLYHSVYDGDHLIFNHDGTLYEPGFIRTARTALATFRPDGYVSLDATEPTGNVLTRVLNFEGKELFVNVATSGGSLRVELQDAGEKPLPGYTMADCKPITSYGVALPIRWGRKDLAKSSGKPIRVRFELKNGSLYGFNFA